MQLGVDGSRIVRKCAIVACMVTLALGGCKKNKTIITGERENIFLATEGVVKNGVHHRGAINLAPAQPIEHWPTASGREDRLAPHAQGAVPVKLTWHKSIGQGSSATERLLNGPIVAEGRLYTLDAAGRLRAVAFDTGTEVFAVDLLSGGQGAQSSQGGMSYSRGVLYAVTSQAEVVAVAAADGRIVHRFKLSAPSRSTPTIHKNHLYVVNINNQTEVFDTSTGMPVWSHLGIMETVGLLGGAPPSVSDDLVVIPYSSGEVFGLLPSSGAVVWQDSLMNRRQLDPVSTLYHIKARPIIDQDMVFIVGNSGVMRGLDKQTGQLRWRKDIGGTRTPAVHGDYIFMVTNAQQLICMQRATGEVLWAVQLAAFKNPKNHEDPILWAGPVLYEGNLVLVSSAGDLQLRSVQDGRVTQAVTIDEKIYISPIIARGHIYILTDSGEVYAYR